MSNYFPEIELDSPNLHISLFPEKGVQLESMHITRRGGRPKSKHAIIVECRVRPIEDLAPSPLQVNIPWKKGDPTKVELHVVEVYEIEQEPMSFDLRQHRSKSTKSKIKSFDSVDGNVTNGEGMTKSRGLTPRGGIKPKKMTGHHRPILDDE